MTPAKRENKFRIDTSSSNRALKIAFLVSVAMILSCWGSQIFGQEEVDAHETPEPAWQLVENDCQANLNYHRRTDADKHSGTRSELLQFSSGVGTKAHFVYDIEDCMAVAEFKPSVWVKSNRAGIRFAALVSFPRSLSPDNKTPITALVTGAAYTEVGTWQKLEITDAENDFVSLVRKKASLLSLQLKQNVDDRGAYVSAIAINAYVGPGETSVLIDDLEMNGVVPLRELGSLKPTAEGTGIPIGGAPIAQQISRPVAVDESMLEIEGRPIFLRLVEHRGESFDFLKQLGFNAVSLPMAPTPSQNAEARRANMWIIAPPPEGFRVIRPSTDFDRILAWQVGKDLSGLTETDDRRSAQELRVTDSTSSTILFGSQKDNFAAASDYLDLVEVGWGTNSIGREDGELYRKLNRARQTMRPNALMIAAIPSDYPSGAMSQIMGMSGFTPNVPLDPTRLKLNCFEAVAAGARGIHFRSSSRLDQLDADSKARVTMIQWVNRWLEFLEPWGAAGLVEAGVTVRNGDYISVGIGTPRAKLVLLLPKDTASWAMRSETTKRTPVTVVDDSRFVSAIAYRITESGVEPLNHQRRPSDVTISLPQTDIVEAIVLTQDSLAIQHLSPQRWDLNRPAPLALHQEIVVYLMSQLSQTVSELEIYQALLPTILGHYRKAGQQVSLAEQQMLTRNYATAQQALTLARQEVTAAKLEIRKPILEKFTSVTSNPLGFDAPFIPSHHAMLLRVGGQDWGGNLNAGGDFEDLNHMLSHGWTNITDGKGELDSSLELAPSSAYAGRFGLRVRVFETPTSPRNKILDRATCIIQSGPIRIEQGKLVRIHGWVRLNASEGVRDLEVKIHDSIAGWELPETPKLVVGQWTEFSMYRYVHTQADYRLTVEILGTGDLSFDEFSVHGVTPLQAGDQACTVPTAQKPEFSPVLSK